MIPDESDRMLHKDALDREMLSEKVQQAKNINVSDIDFCEYNKKLAFNYSWAIREVQNFLRWQKLIAQASRNSAKVFSEPSGSGKAFFSAGL